MTVIIGIDPHKTTHMAVAIDGDEQAIARLEVTADRAQTQRAIGVGVAAGGPADVGGRIGRWAGQVVVSGAARRR
jgi:hypothetical protein